MKNLQSKKMLPSEASEVSSKLMEVFNAFVASECTESGRRGFAVYAAAENILARMREGAEVWLLKEEENIAAVGEFVLPAHITLLFVLPAYQGSGAGGLLFKRLIDRIQSRNKDQADLKITVNAVPAAQGFYKRLGFVPTTEWRYIEGIPSVPMVLEMPC